MQNQNPAEQLTRKRKLPNGWTVQEKVPKTEASTGGRFSVGYIVANASGRMGFLKALDLSDALSSPDVTETLRSLLDSYAYERDLLQLCQTNSLNHVASTIAYGQINAGELHDLLPVPYLIFELADGDIRSKLELSDKFELAFCLRALHHCAVGLSQLHTHRIVHQDLKPSNVLVFGDSFCQVSDLGRSTRRELESPTDQYLIPGDARYAPPELLYGSKSSEWGIGRVACDLYHLGSLAFFFFTKVGITPTWLKYLPPALRPKVWTQTYEDVLPYVRSAHEAAIEEFAKEIPLEIRDRLVESIRQLCDPDPGRRGHPRNRLGNSNPYSLQRYVSRFDLLGRHAELQMKRSLI